MLQAFSCTYVVDTLMENTVTDPSASSGPGPAEPDNTPTGYHGGTPQGRWYGQNIGGNPSDGADQTRAYRPVGDQSSQAYQEGYGYSSYPGYQAQPGPYAGAATYPGYAGPPPSPKSKVAAAVLAFFLGGFGVHNFYIGNKGRAIAQVVVNVVSWLVMFGGYGMLFAGIDDSGFTTYSGMTYYNNDDTLIGGGIIMIIAALLGLVAVGIWAFIEFIMILVGAGRYGRDAQGRPLT